MSFRDTHRSFEETPLRVSESLGYSISFACDPRLATDMPRIISLQAASTSPAVEIEVAEAPNGRSRRSTVSSSNGRSRRSTNAASREHFAGIDALRAFAAVAVVLLHACVPYAQPSMAGLSWSVRDTSSGPITVMFWAIEIVVMPIFLVVAGFFAARSIAARGGWSVTIARLRRLGWPLALAIVFLLPVDFYVWMIGWLADGLVTLREVRRIKFAAGVDRYLWGLSHLWFLQYLMIYTILLATAWPWLRRCSARSIVHYGLPSLVVGAVLSLAMRPEVVWGFQHAFLPVVSKWVYSGAFFAAGVFWFQLDPQLRRIATSGPRLLGPGLLLSAAAVSMGMWWLDAAGDPLAWLHGGWASAPAMNASTAPTAGFPIGGVWIRGGLATLTVAAAAITTFALVGIAATRVRPLGPVISSLAGGSFFIYILHHPVVALAHISAKYAAPGVSPLAKVAVVTTLGVAAGWSVSWLVANRRERMLEQSEATRSIEFPQTVETPGRTRRAA